MTITQRSCKEYLGSYRDCVGLSGYYPSNAESNEKKKEKRNLITQEFQGFLMWRRGSESKPHDVRFRY